MDAIPYHQSYIFFVSLIGGFVIGFTWDLYRILRYYIALGKKGTILGDIIFWLLSSYIILRIIIYSSWGNLRGYIFMGFLFGGTFYFCFLSKYILKIIIFITRQVVLFVIYIWFLITYIIMLLKFQIIKNIKPYKIKFDNDIIEKRRKYKFFKYKVKKVLNEKKIIYNNNRKKHRNKRKNIKRRFKKQKNIK